MRSADILFLIEMVHMFKYSLQVLKSLWKNLFIKKVVKVVEL
jgi:hypothetical protein